MSLLAQYVCCAEAVTGIYPDIRCVCCRPGFEHSGKMAGGGKSEIGPDSGQSFIRIAEEAFCFLRFFLQDEIRQALARLLPAIKSSVTDLRFEQKKASVLTAFQML